MRDELDAAAKAAIWQAICEQAREHGLSPDEWLAVMSRDSRSILPSSFEHGRGVEREDAEHDTATAGDLKEIDLEPREARMLAAAIHGTLQTGEPRSVGPIGARERRYELLRDDGLVGIRVGAATTLRLSPSAAQRLASVLDGSAGHADAEGVAA